MADRIADEQHTFALKIPAIHLEDTFEQINHKKSKRPKYGLKCPAQLGPHLRNDQIKTLGTDEDSDTALLSTLSAFRDCIYTTT